MRVGSQHLSSVIFLEHCFRFGLRNGFPSDDKPIVYAASRRSAADAAALASRLSKKRIMPSAAMHRRKQFTSRATVSYRVRLTLDGIVQKGLSAFAIETMESPPYNGNSSVMPMLFSLWSLFAVAEATVIRFAAPGYICLSTSDSMASRTESFNVTGN